MIDVGVLGATGIVGERIVRRLVRHPWFRLTEVAASSASAGARLGDALAAPPDGLDGLVLREMEGPWSARLILSALPASAAREVERRLAAEGHLVVSNASSHRMAEDAPLVVPEINPDHLRLLPPGSGGIVTNPNCSVAGLAVALAPLHARFGVERVSVTTFQAISGAGRPGPAAGDILDNVIPFIGGEEDKIEQEPRKILGTLRDGSIESAPFRVSATATRVPVAHGHLASVSVRLATEADPAAVVDAITSHAWGNTSGLPSSRGRPLVHLAGDDRPQPLLDRDRGGGMTVSVGRVRRCPLEHVKFLVLVHNLERGAAGAAVLNAELWRASEVARTSAGRAGDAA